MGRGRPAICPFCSSQKSQKKGIRKTKTMGTRRIRLCKGCGRKFTPKHQKPLEEQVAEQ
jgi:transcriptional regulator NrdR family protein